MRPIVSLCAALALSFATATTALAAGTDDAERVNDKLRGVELDNFGEPIRIRADGRVMRDHYLLQVKSPQQATGPTDHFLALNTIPADTAYLPLAQSKCALAKQ